MTRRDETVWLTLMKVGIVYILLTNGCREVSAFQLFLFQLHVDVCLQADKESVRRKQYVCSRDSNIVLIVVFNLARPP
jgi:hypothetical protein